MGIVKSLDDAIAPGFSFGDEDDLDPCVKAKVYEEPKAPRIPVRAPEGEFVVNLEKAGNTKASPLSKKCLTNGLCLLGRENFQGNGVAVGIDKMAVVEADSTPKIAWSDKVQLVKYSWLGSGDLRIQRSMVCTSLIAP